MTWSHSSASSKDTEAVGEKIGAALRGGEVIELASDVGGGKTTFVRGLARGFGSQDHVASPTFTISREYKSETRTMYHFDFYRLDDAGIMANEIGEVIGDHSAVIVVEWADVVAAVLPDERIRITLSYINQNKRQLDAEYPEAYAYVFKAVS